MTLRAGWRLALGALTIIPSGPVAPSPGAARGMVALAPVAVLPLALGASGLTALGGWVGAPALVTGLLVVGWLALTTRAMHLDAVADVADGLGAGWDPDRARNILKRGDVGPMGVVALVLLIGLQASAIAAHTLAPQGWLLVGAAVAVSRWFLALLCAGVPAMPGSRLGAVYAGALAPWQAAVGVVAVTAVLTGAVVLAGSAWWWGLLAGAAATAVVLVLRAQARRRFGGVNGDVLGAGIEMGLTTLLVVLACR